MLIIQKYDKLSFALWQCQKMDFQTEIFFHKFLPKCCVLSQYTMILPFAVFLRSIGRYLPVCHH